jgi:hypothetical protein
VVTSYRASNDAIGTNTAQTNVTWTANSAGLSFNAAGYAGTTTAVTGAAVITLNSLGLRFDGVGLAGTSTGFTGANISASMTHNSAGLAMSMSVAAPGGGGGSQSIGMSTQTAGGATAGTAGYASGSAILMHFAPGSNITMSQSVNGASATLSIFAPAPGAAVEANPVNLLGANTSGNTTATGSTLGFSGVNMTLSGTNASQIVFSVPATSSLVGTSGLSVSTAGSTISVYQRAVGGRELFPLGDNTTFTTLGLNSIYFQRFVNEGNVSFNYLEFRASGSTVSSTNSQRGAHTYDYGIYSRDTANTSQYVLISSSRFIMDVSISSNVSAAYTISQGAASITSSSAGTGLLSDLSGFKHLYFPYTGTLTRGGEYAIALRMSSATSGGTNAFRIAIKQMSMMNNLTIGKIGTGGVTATNASFVGDFAQGVYGTTSSALLNTIALSGLTNAISQMRMYIQFEV